MSTEPGQDDDGAGTAGKGGDRKPGPAKSGPAKSTGKSRGKPGKTVAAASAKSGRDETTVDIDTGATDPVGKGDDETRADLTQIDDASAKPADTPEIAPVKDTAAQPKPAARPAPPVGGAAGAPAGSASGPAGGPRPAAGSGSAGWAKPAEPSGSVSTGRTDTPGKAFNSAGGPSGNSGGSGGRGFAGTVLKDRPSTAMAPAGAASKPAPGKPARKAQLQLARLEPWSVMKFSFVMSLVCFVILLVAVIVLYVILSGLGVFDAISDTVNSLTKEQGETTGSVDAGSWFSFIRVFGYTVLVGALNVLLITALSTVGSVIYNLAADLVGGVEVTLREAE
ncbi:Transmembrane protein of unknown function [Actinomadura mexicana]|uniref:DUF3566 domain-containing protein n=1 Tax=Actinomadura mexicana TaxID=134959 RepID=A0A238W1F1_9ACTN|nr:DUF3566 domain-containing protein [Actinomadura mexicana]SNR40227.1 Transmembrane protein of unknown function [Actinomadura mexicana]